MSTLFNGTASADVLDGVGDILSLTSSLEFFCLSWIQQSKRELKVDTVFIELPQLALVDIREVQGKAVCLALLAQESLF